MSEILGSLFKYLLAALGLIALVVVVQRTFGSDSTNTAAGQQSQIAQGISQLYRGNGLTDVSAISNASVITGGAIPTEMTTGDGKTINGPWTASAVTITPNSTTRYVATWTQVPNSGCAKFARSQKVAAVSINGGGVIASGDVGSITKACGTGDGNTIAFFIDA